MSKELTDICRVRVKFSETDAMQRVWHGSYVTYFEDGRESFGRRYPGIGYADIQRSGIYAPVYDLHVRYLAPLCINDVAEIHTRYVPKPGARLDFEYEVYREEGHILCATGSTTQLFIDPAGQLLLDLPDYYARWKQQFLAE
ncbi:MAG TPA: acyl-CoA thioesterase [Candidatus Bacteroides merdigallinarum]|uniref:Acyl-CoA thioesterase n=1 Tax=Candidatus Bacteroides merdigallinarum TaxID=2838473 RepID=A0A9D2J224_9BACE|nr:acyl-CoA thioesterase [Candidatus Bacteroides merdigallinarum]